MLTHTDSLIKNVLDKKHHIEAEVCTFLMGGNARFAEVIFTISDCGIW